MVDLQICSQILEVYKKRLSGKLEIKNQSKKCQSREESFSFDGSAFLYWSGEDYLSQTLNT